MPEPVYLSIDPGETAGWCYFDAEGNPTAYGQFRFTDVVKELDVLFVPTIEVCIVEKFKNTPWTIQRGVHTWSDNKTSQQIGQIDMMCQMRDVKMVKQETACKGMGFMYMGMAEPSDHSISHQFVAMAHGVFYLQTNGIIAPGKFMPKDKT